MNTSSVEEIEALPEFLADKIKGTDEYKGRLTHEGNMAKLNRPSVIGAKEEVEINPDDIPF